MQQDKAINSRVRRTVNDLVMAEMFLIQATLESATAIGDAMEALGRQISQEEQDTEESVQDILQRIRSEAFEPYRSRYEYFKKMLDPG